MSFFAFTCGTPSRVARTSGHNIRRQLFLFHTKLFQPRCLAGRRMVGLAFWPLARLIEVLTHCQVSQGIFITIHGFERYANNPTIRIYQLLRCFIFSPGIRVTTDVKPGDRDFCMPWVSARQSAIVVKLSMHLQVLRKANLLPR